MVIGNSSSGLIEAPSFKIPTVNIGDRQKGRIKAKSIIDCELKSTYIIKAIHKAKNMKPSNTLKNEINPYGDGYTSNKVNDIICNVLLNENIDLKKKFYDILN